MYALLKVGAIDAVVARSRIEITVVLSVVGAKIQVGTMFALRQVSIIEAMCNVARSGFIGKARLSIPTYNQN